MKNKKLTTLFCRETKPTLAIARNIPLQPPLSF